MSEESLACQACAWGAPPDNPSPLSRTAAARPLTKLRASRSLQRSAGFHARQDGLARACAQLRFGPSGRCGGETLKCWFSACKLGK